MMKKISLFKKLGLVIGLAALLALSACTTQKKVITDDFATDAADAGFSDSELGLEEDSSSTGESADSTADAGSGATDDFAEFNDQGSPNQAANSDSADSDVDADLEQELNQASSGTENASAENPPPPEIAANDQQSEPVAETPPAPIVDAPQTPEVSSLTEAPVENPPPIEVAAPEPAAPIAKIKAIQFKSNNSGGALVIDSDSALNYTTRLNSQTNQVIIEVQNAVVPTQLKRPLNTKDMTSSIGHIDIYQKNKSNVARFVVQLRPNSPEPLVQPEGNSLVIIGSPVGAALLANGSQLSNSDSTSAEPYSSSSTASGSNATAEAIAENDSVNSIDINPDLTAKGIMSSSDIEDFLANNNKFYGRKISIETTDMDVRDILKFISEESGINMVFDDDVSGKASLKLRKVPWDQALVILLKSKKLAYRRQGTILRIARVDSIVKEDEDAIKLREAKATVDPLVVKNFAINYAEVDKLETKIKDFINDTKKDAVNRGRVTSDLRTGTLIVTETATKLAQVEALIKALDTQPQQVTIESRVVEASDDYARTAGVTWGLNRDGVAFGAARQSRTSQSLSNALNTTGPVNISPTLGVTPNVGTGSSALDIGIWAGSLGAFGNLDAQLRLDETQRKIKILSSPRVTVLTNTSATINQGFTVLQPSTSTSTTGTAATTQTFTPVQVGVSLKVKPQISNVGTIRLNLDVTRSAQVPGTTDTSNRNVQTEVIVKSGHTAVIGGVFQADVASTKNGIPGLQDIPILGTLFRGTSSLNAKTELMIFVTPKILAPMIPVNAGAEPDAPSTISE